MQVGDMVKYKDPDWRVEELYHGLVMAPPRREGRGLFVVDVLWCHKGVITGEQNWEFCNELEVVSEVD